MADTPNCTLTVFYAPFSDAPLAEMVQLPSRSFSYVCDFRTEREICRRCYRALVDSWSLSENLTVAAQVELRKKDGSFVYWNYRSSTVDDDKPFGACMQDLK